MKVIEKRMSYQVIKTIVSGRIIKKYKIPLDQIQELNNKYDEKKYQNIFYDLLF